MAKKQLTGIQKSALLFITLGPEASADILKRLPENEIQKITYEIANISTVTSEQRHSILQEFLEMNKAKDYLLEGGLDYAKELLSKALGPQRAGEILNKVAEASQLNRPFAIARKADAQQILNIINYEHPQTIALILCYLQVEKAAQIISELPEEIQSEVALRIATMNTTSPDVIREIEKVLDDKLSTIVKTETTVLGGIDTLVGILNQVDRTTEKNITESLQEQDYELAEKIKSCMFVFEDIITKNQSKRAAASLKEDIEYLGPVRLTDVEKAQQQIVAVIRRLEDAQEIIISRGGEDALIM